MRAASQSYPGDLSDEQWDLLASLIPPVKRGGRRRSVNMRAVINALFYVLCMGCQLAERFKVSLSFVRNLLRHYRQTGQVQAKQRGGHLRPLIDGEHLQLVQRLLEEQNDALLSQLCERFQQRTSIVVSVPMMHRAVQKLRITHKKNSVS